MFRSSNNKRCLLLLSALTAALLWLAPAHSVRAAAYTYNARQRTINAGVLFLGSAADLAFPSGANSPAPVPDPAPFVFYVLDQRPDVKPVGWRFVNPLAQSTVSAAMSNRWNGAYQAGTGLSPTMASYWEVALRDVSADDLQQFDVLYIVGSYIVGSNSVPVTLTPADNEKLRRFVDGGGQLIVDYGVATGSQPQFSGALTLFSGTTWTAGAVGTGSSLTPPFASSPGLLDLHPLFAQPNLFLANDLSSLGASSPDGSFGTIAEAASGSLFSTVLLQGSLHGVDAAQLGAGQIISSALNLGPTVSISQGALFSAGPFFARAPYFNSLITTYSPSVVPASDLKFLSNAISWADTHPTENKTSHQNAAGPSSASFTAAWAYPVSGNSSTSSQGPPGAAVHGDYVYVTDSAGVLHAFDAIPDEALTGQPSADDGLVDFISATPTPYDEIWNANVGVNASGPTVATVGGATYVFVETANGSVLQFNSISTAANVAPVKTYASPGTTTFSPNNTPTTPHAPAPTFYDGRIYAGQPDGTMFVVGLNGGSAGGGVAVSIDPTAGGAGSSAYATAAPAVGLLGSGPVSNSIIALVPTTQNMNTVLLGARNDPLSLYSPNGQFTGFNVNRLARFSLFNLFIDTTSPGRAYDSNGNNVVNVSGDRDPVFLSNTLPANVDDYFGDWDADFVKSTTQGGNPQAGLTLHEIKALSLSNTAGGGATLSAPAIDRQGDYYYVVNAGADSYLFGVHDDTAQRNVRIKFRFRLPKTGDTSTVNPAGGPNWNNIDADNVHYDGTDNNSPPTIVTNSNGATNSLLDYHFVGAPVVDGQGNVYVAAQNGTTGPAAVLCFSADQEVTATPPGNLAVGFDATQSRYFQIDESSGNAQNPLVAIPNPGRGAGRYGQITTAGAVASVFNFGRGSGGSRQIAGNLCEPQPFTATPSGPNGGSATWMYFHTNLAWYATFSVNGQISGVSKSGNTLLLCDGGPSIKYNTLYKLPAAPTIGTGKLAALTVRKAPLGTGAGGTYLNVGTVTAAPSAGGGAMVINGTSGVAAFNQQLTLIADNNRILEVDADGNAVWSADATTRAAANGTSTKVDFAHPSALTQFAPNDYLVADTGNNRCVRFDRGGGVTWELTRFYDPSGLMAPGQPFTLSQPTSVEVRTEFFNYPDPFTQAALKGQLVHYLVADAGNDRIVEVTDTLDAAGNILNFDLNGNVVAPGTANSVTHDHLLTWVTHTGDKYGRRYQYAGASYLTIPGVSQGPSTTEVFALVTNTRIAPLTQVTASPLVYALGAASGDAPGGSIVAFSRPASPAPFTTATNDLIYVATSYTAGAQTFPVRNPRFLHVYAPPQAAPSSGSSYQYSFLYADSNGAFDLVYTGPTTPLTSYGLAFTQADYRAMSLGTNPISADFQGNLPLRNGAAATASLPAVPPIPFVPTCVQRLNDDATNNPKVDHIERYLITQSYSQGELARAPGSGAPTRLGGEIFEVDISTTAAGAVTIDPVGGFAGAVTLSRPVGTGPLTQPTFAIRTTQ